MTELPSVFLHVTRANLFGSCHQDEREHRRRTPVTAVRRCRKRVMHCGQAVIVCHCLAKERGGSWRFSFFGGNGPKQIWTDMWRKTLHKTVPRKPSQTQRVTQSLHLLQDFSSKSKKTKRQYRRFQTPIKTTFWQRGATAEKSTRRPHFQFHHIKLVKGIMKRLKRQLEKAAPTRKDCWEKAASGV